MIAVPIRSRRSVKALFVQKLQHAIPSVVVLKDGLDHLAHRADTVDVVLGGAEVVVAGLVIGSVFRGIRDVRRQIAAPDAEAHHHHGADWIDIAIGAMLCVEAYAHYHATAHVPRPTVLLGVAMIVIGILHPLIARAGDRRRELRVSADGISVSTRPFSRLSLTWPDAASIDIDDASATITAHDGRSRRINLRDVFHATAIRDALMQARTFLDASHHAARASVESTATNS